MRSPPSQYSSTRYILV